MPNAAYIAPMGWQVLAGLMVNAFLSISNAVVCLSNISIMFEVWLFEKFEMFCVSSFQIVLYFRFKDYGTIFLFLIMNYAF